MSTFTDRWRGNFDGNGSSQGDLFLFDNFGNNAIWLMNGAGNQAAGANLPFTGPTWHAKAIAEFNDAGLPDSDILWQNDDGRVALWQMNGMTLVGGQDLPNPGAGWHANFANDFNGNTAADILFQHDNGSLAIWTFAGGGTPVMNGGFNVPQNPGPGWHAAATGDTSGDGRAGIVFQHDNGSIAIWENPVFNPAGTVSFGAQADLQFVGPTWHVMGMGDVNGDLRSDIILQNDDGRIAVWEMGGPTGTTIIGGFNVAQNPGTGWHVAAVRDMNSDSRADLIFQNDNGAGAIWAGFAATGGADAAFMVQQDINPSPNPFGHLDWHIV